MNCNRCNTIITYNVYTGRYFSINWRARSLDDPCFLWGHEPA